MIWLQLKQGLALFVITLNLILVGWALWTYRRRQPLPDGYYRVLLVAPAVALALPLLGVLFWGQGSIVRGMHLFYGILVSLGLLAQFALRRHTAAGHRYRTRPLVHAALALFVLLLTVRSWMAA